MLKYLVAEVSGKQYKIVPGKPTVVDFLGEIKKFDCDKVLLKVDGDKVEVGTPYLKGSVAFEVLEGVKKTKIRVATYKAKANTRKVIGQKTIRSIIQLAA